MTQPVVGAAAQELYDRLAPIYGLDDEQHDWSLLQLCAAFVAGLELLEVLMPTDAHLPWAVLLDVDECPEWALPWLAWLLGLTIRKETGEQLRALCRDRPPAKRGTPEAMVAAVQSVLSGTRNVRWLPRAGGPFEDTIVTRASETPPTDLLTAPLTNLVANPNARQAPYTQGWTVSAGGSLGPALDPDLDGHGLRATWYPTGSLQSLALEGDLIPVTGGNWYGLRCRVKVVGLTSPTWPVILRFRYFLFQEDGVTPATGTSVAASSVSSPSTFTADAADQILDYAGVAQASANTAFVRPRIYAALPAGAAVQLVVGKFLLAEVLDETSPVPPYVEGTQQPTTIVLAAAEPQRRVASLLTHVITDEPLIADWTLTIDDVSAAIDDLTLTDVTAT